MNLLIIIAGLTGTLGMTVFIELICFTFKKPFHVVRILSFMLYFDASLNAKHKTSLLYLTALTVHYTIGVLFSYAFKFCLESGLMELDLWTAVAFGAFAGLVGIIGWRIFFAVHPSPPKLILSQFLFIIWVGHLIYAVTIFLIYLKFQPTPVQAIIPVC